MDRYRRGERDRDDPNTHYLGAGESYRPGGGDPPTFRPPERDRNAGDTWTADRRDDRRDTRRDDPRDNRREEIDSYIPPTSTRAQRPRSRSPGTFRRRSRSPVGRGRDDTYPSRARSPPRRFSPRRDDRARSPPRRRSRSPFGGRPRSPPDSKRPREYSAGPRRSPPPAKRERLASPPRNRYDAPRSPPRRTYSPPRDVGRGGYRPRSRTPPRRDDRQNAFKDDNWRQRSPSPRPSGPGSNNTSRRSSPPVHPDRVSLAGSLPRSPAYPTRNQYDGRPNPSPQYRARSPPRPDPSVTRQRSPPRTFPDRTRDTSPGADRRRNGDTAPFQPPSGPGGYRNGSQDRPPPSGPSRGYSQTTRMSPPAGPSAPMSMSAHNRTGTPSMLSAPTRPRGAPPGRFDGPQRDFSNPAAPRGRGSSMTYRGGPPRAVSYHSSDFPPPGPRNSISYGRGEYGGHETHHRSSFGRGAGGPSDAPFPFRQHNNSSSTTYPRTQRFNNNSNSASQITTTEKIVEGGKLLPSGLPPEQEKKIKMLEAEAERIRLEIAEKQKAKREALTEWEVRERESEREGLKSELAEMHLQKLTEGENGAGAAF